MIEEELAAALDEIRFRRSANRAWYNLWFDLSSKCQNCKSAVRELKKAERSEYDRLFMKWLETSFRCVECRPQASRFQRDIRDNDIAVCAANYKLAQPDYDPCRH